MKLVVLGGGESGVGAALLGRRLGYEVFLSDKGRIAGRYRDILVAEGLPFEEGRHSEDRIFAADLVVKSPGIPDTVPMVVRLREMGKEVISEIEFAGRHTSSTCVCITGSNGKTTTTLLTCHILRQAGLDASLAGNVGQSLAAQVADAPHDIYVVELSSFQLDGMFRFRADVAVLTNITPDHLDRYGFDFRNYINSKFRIINNMDQDNLFIYGADSVEVTKKLSTLDLKPEAAPFTYGDRPAVKGNGAWMEGNEVVVRYRDREFRIAEDEISIKGRHNIYNAMCAILACMRLGLGDGDIAAGLRSFPQVEHRLETVAVKDGVTYINDSKATNVDAAWYALDSMHAPVVWIAGGTDKGNDYAALYSLVKEKVKVLVCMGLDNRKLVDSFSPICKVVSTDNLADAMAAARENAGPGDVVLLSPCCASFDLFKNYENRGELFKEAVRGL